MPSRPLKLSDLKPGLRRKIAAHVNGPENPLLEAFKQSQKQRLVRNFLETWNALGGPALTPEHQFAQYDNPKRGWRLDLAHLPAMVAVEIHGGTYAGGRHVTGTGFAEDRVKMNRAIKSGWVVFELTDKTVRDREEIGMILKVLKDRSKVF